MEVKNILAEAWEAVQEAGVPDPLQATAFEKAVDLIAATQGRTNNTRNEALKVSQEEQQESGSVLDSIAKKLELDVELVGQVYGEENGEPHLVVPARRIDPKKQTGTRQLAILVVAGRQAALPEDTTLVQVVRDVAEDYKRLDQNNFQKALQGLDHILLIRGRGASQTLKLSKPGWAEATKLIMELGALTPEQH